MGIKHSTTSNMHFRIFGYLWEEYIKGINNFAKVDINIPEDINFFKFSFIQYDEMNLLL
jgi:NADH/NAD ratio-sensing transcriptional regulator Rex